MKIIYLGNEIWGIEFEAVGVEALRKFLKLFADTPWVGKE